MRSEKLFIFLSVIAALASCVHKSNVAPVVAMYDQPYGADSRQVADIFLPAVRSAGQTPVIVMLHGGGWNSGDKSDFYYAGVHTLCLYYGYAVVNMNYRLSNSGNIYPSQLDDVDAVMKMIAQHAGEWKVNAHNICFLGRSAGGSIALQYAYTRNTDNNIKGVLDFFGPADFRDSSYSSAPLRKDIASYLGSAVNINPQLWAAASPVTYTSTGVPTFIVQGTADTTVHPIQSAELEQQLVSNNIPCVLDTLPGRGHFLENSDWIGEGSRGLVWLSHYLQR
ncbi:alpha/beta hydrolase fold domain-containing protein [Chitinophagaceae bacterium MMS25-I14]